MTRSIFGTTLILASILFSVTQASASPEKIAAGLRLIQTDTDQVAWMNQSQIDEVAHARHLSGRCGGFKDVTDFPKLEASEESFRPMPFELLAKESLSRGSEVRQVLSELSATNLKEIVSKLSSYPTRHCKSAQGVEAAEWIKLQFERLARGRNNVAVVSVPNKNFKQPSVIARIFGKGEKAKEIVVIGGHLDSINVNMFEKRAPGADDNASGVAILLEVFRVLMETDYQPERTIEFMAYAGEEIGLVGSQQIAREYKKYQKNVVAAIQFDMAMDPGETPVIQFVTDHTNPGLTNFTRKLADAYVKIPWRNMKCGYGCSDHASWNDEGYPAVFPTVQTMEEVKKGNYIHSVRDTMDRLEPQFGLEFAKLGAAFVVELSKP
jgi:bacterial leucyl aminopeptidase